MQCCIDRRHGGEAVANKRGAHVEDEEISDESDTDEFWERVCALGHSVVWHG